MNRKNKIPKKAETLIDKNSKITGDIESANSLKISGRVDGNIICHSNVYIDKGSVINGNIKGKNLFIFGIVQGDVTSDGKLYLNSTGKLFGEVKAHSFISQRGSVFKGSCTMAEDFEKDNLQSDLIDESSDAPIKEETLNDTV